MCDDLPMYMYVVLVVTHAMYVSILSPVTLCPSPDSLTARPTTCNVMLIPILFGVGDFLCDPRGGGGVDKWVWFTFLWLM